MIDPIFMQAGPGDISRIMEWVKVGGIPLMFIVWYITVKYLTKAQQDNTKENMKTVENLTEKMTDAYKDSIEAQQEQNKVLREIIKERQENDSHLISVLTRIKEKLDQPVKCPLHEQQKFNRTKQS